MRRQRLKIDTRAKAAENLNLRAPNRSAEGRRVGLTKAGRLSPGDAATEVINGQLTVTL